MEFWSEYIKFLTGLIAIINPIGALPIFVGLMSAHPDIDPRRTGFVSAFTVVVVLTIALLAGEILLEFFGISIGSFRIGGGILILLMAISMMQGQISPVKQTQEEAQDAEEKTTIAVVPMGIPLLAGPGAISTVIVYAHRDASILHHVLMGAIILLVGLIVWFSLRSAPFLATLLGRIGINIVTRVMGLITAAISVEFIVNGLKQMFPGIITP